jgi:hypothetical protein
MPIPHLTQEQLDALWDDLLAAQREQGWERSIKARLKVMSAEQLDELSTGLQSMSDEELAARLEQA